MVQRVTGRRFFQATAQIHDFSLRSDDFDCIDLMPGGAVFNGTIATGVGRDIATDHATIAAAGISGVKQAFLLRRLLYVVGADAGLDHHIHCLFINLQHLVHPFCADDNPAEQRHRGRSQASASATGNHGDQCAVGQFHDLSDLLRILREHDRFRHMLITGVCFLVM